MHYKTIAMDLLEQYPALHEKLRQQRQLFQSIDSLALTLKSRHESWKETCSQTQPGLDPCQILSMALELALQDLQDQLASATPPEASEPISLDAAMAFLHRRSSSE